MNLSSQSSADEVASSHGSSQEWSSSYLKQYQLSIHSSVTSLGLHNGTGYRAKLICGSLILFVSIYFTLHNPMKRHRTDMYHKLESTVIVWKNLVP